MLYKKILAVIAAIFISLFTKQQALSDDPAFNFSSIYDIPLQTIEQKASSLEPYKGQVMLIVNVASRCGLTPQYETLEKIYQKYKGQGFVVLGFPSNDFMGQEPGSDEQIKQFCQANYNISFPLFAKNSVLGKSKQDLYKFLVKNAPPTEPGEVRWNFEKFLISKQGQVAARFKPAVLPDSPEVIAAIEAALAE